MSRRALGLLGATLLATLLVAFVLLGAVRPAAQVWLHGLVAVATLFAALLPDRKLASAGFALRWAAAGVLPLTALAFGVLPVPRAVAAFVAPGLLAARPGAAWVALAADPDRVPGELATVLLVLSFGAVTAVWGAARYKRGVVELVVVAGTGLLATSALLHAAAGARTMLGVVAPEHVSAPFFAPFVNGNHAAAAVLLGGPVALALALDRNQEVRRRVVAAVVCVAAVGVVAWTFSSGAIVAAGVAAAFWALRTRNLLRPSVLLVGVGVAAVAQLAAGSVAWGQGSVGTRARLWRDSLQLVADHWAVGAGGGTFGEAIRPYRSDLAFATIAHTHSDPLEWLVETGAAGGVALAAFFFVIWPRGRRESRRGDALGFGLLAVLLHSFVEFPLQIPAIALWVAGIGVCLLAVYSPRRPAAPRAVRGMVLAVGLLQIPAAAWQLREAAVAEAITEVYAYRADPTAAVAGVARLEQLHAGGPERLLYAAWSAEGADDPDVAIAAALRVRDEHPDRPDALRAAAVVLARAGRYDEATDVLERVVARDPSDYRPWVVLARIARAQRDDALAAKRWAAAFARSAPGLDEAYETLPLGLYWLDVFADTNPSYSFLLVNKLVSVGDLEVALLACDQAARLDPVAYGDLLARASILVKLGRAGEAEGWLREVLVRRPEDPRVYAELGNALSALGRHAEATAAFLRGARMAPALKLAALRSAAADGGPAEALVLGHRFELEGAVDAEVRLEIARLRLLDGDPTGCVRDIERWKLVAAIPGGRAEVLLGSCRGAGRR